MSGMEWIATEARTGRIITDLPHLSVPRIAAVLGSYTTALASLPVPSAPEPWQRATKSGATVMILLDDGAPQWGGMVITDEPSTDDEIPLSLITIEGRLDGIFIRDDLTYTATGQNAIVADLIARYVVDGAGGRNGFPIRVEGGTGGTVRDRKYKDADDKSVLSALTELAGVDGGPEWTIGFEHLTNPERYCPVLYVGDRIGVSPIAGLAPAATFDMASVTWAALKRDFSAGKGATDVMASSSAVADVRPQSPHQTSADPDRPRVEHRFTPSTSISVVSTLTAHAARVLADMANGARTLSLMAALSEAPRLGRDWALGDDVGFVVGGVDSTGRDTVPAFPGGLSGSARCIGWEMTLPAAGVVGTITPTLVLPGESA